MENCLPIVPTLHFCTVSPSAKFPMSMLLCRRIWLIWLAEMRAQTVRFILYNTSSTGLLSGRMRPICIILLKRGIWGSGLNELNKSFKAINVYLTEPGAFLPKFLYWPSYLMWDMSPGTVGCISDCTDSALAQGCNFILRLDSKLSLTPNTFQSQILCWSPQIQSGTNVLPSFLIGWFLS